MRRVWGICPYKEMRGRKMRCANLELKLELGRDYDLDQSLFGNSGEGGSNWSLKLDRHCLD